MSKQVTLLPHPRLYIGPAELARLKRPTRRSLLGNAAEIVAETAEQFVRSVEIDWTPDTHNGHLIRARKMQGRVVTLLVRWKQTGEQRFRDAAVRHIEDMGGWEYWSWIAWREGDSRPEAVFDLSYGENSATLAIAYDLLFDTLSADERTMFLQIAQDRAFCSFLHNTSRGNVAGWFGKPDTNWNTVCAGGAGMLALAMYENLPEARRTLPRVERSVTPFMKTIRKTDGAWPEGIGYWNYGFRYAFMYLLSWEHAHGRSHSLITQPATRKTLAFPLDFCPNGVACSFGDVNRWTPPPFHYAAAERLKMTELIGRLDLLLRDVQKPGNNNWWPNAADLLLLHPRKAHKAAARKNVVKLYKGQDWGILADRIPAPSMCLSVRGGTTEVPHGHLDLLSFHCVIGDEAMISNVSPDEYLDSTFGPRRRDLPEMRPDSKNTIFINGVGIVIGSAVKTSALRIAGFGGIRMDATAAMGASRSGLAADFCGRLFLMLPGVGFLIVDRIELPFTGRVESRLHTFADVQLQRRGAKLIGKREKLRIAYDCDVPAALHTARMAPTTPAVGARQLRWCTGELLHHQVTMATLLTPGTAAAKVSVTSRRGAVLVTVAAGKRTIRIPLTTRLRHSR